VGDDEEESTQALLRLVHKDRPRPPELPEVFDARADASRIALLALAHLGPRDLGSGEPIDIAALLEERDKDAFVKILRHSNLRGSRSAANRILHPSGASFLRLLKKHTFMFFIDDWYSPILGTHAIDQRATELLGGAHYDGFLSRRSEILTEEIRRFSERMAAWDHNDRPSIEYLLTEARAEA
jgi:hypothetical protein